MKRLTPAQRLYWVSEIRTDLITFLHDCLDRGVVTQMEVNEELYAFEMIVGKGNMKNDQ